MKLLFFNFKSVDFLTGSIKFIDLIENRPIQLELTLLKIQLNFLY